MTAGFINLDNRITIMYEMYIQDRNDRLARQKEKDKQNETAENVTEKKQDRGNSTITTK